MSTSAYGGNPDTLEGSSVDPIVAQPSVEQAPLQGTNITDLSRFTKSMYYSISWATMHVYCLRHLQCSVITRA